MQLFIFLLIGSYITMSTVNTQRTHNRSCECEYNSNGECVYSLVFPSKCEKNCSEKFVTNSPPTPDTPGSSRPDMSDGQMHSLEVNLEKLSVKVEQHQTTIMALQNLMMELQATSLRCFATRNVNCNQSDVSVSIPEFNINSTDLDTKFNRPILNETLPEENFTVPILNVSMPEENILMPDMYSNFTIPDIPVPECCSDIYWMQANLTLLMTEMHKIRLEFSQSAGSNTGFEQTMRELAPLLDDLSVLQPRLTDALEVLDVLQKELAVLKQHQLVINASRFGGYCLERGALGNWLAQNNKGGIRILRSTGLRPVAEIGSIRTGPLDTTWCINAQPNGTEAFIEYDLRKEAQIHGVLTLGHADDDEWVTSYKVYYARDTNEDKENRQWLPVRDPIGNQEIFEGNTDRSTLKTNIFLQPFLARHVRVVPLAANDNGGEKCMRIDLVGCIDTFIDV